MDTFLSHYIQAYLVIFYHFKAVFFIKYNIFYCTFCPMYVKGATWNVTHNRNAVLRKANGKTITSKIGWLDVQIPINILLMTCF